MKAYLKQQWLRNQMEEALWTYLCTLPHWGNTDRMPDIPQVFRSRVKKLLNIDRVKGGEDNNWVFFDEEGGGTGTQELYSDFHVFMMGIALHMLNLGFKQSEVIFFLQHTQSDIQKYYVGIRSADLVAPISGTNRNVVENTIQHFMLINRVEIQEIFPRSANKKPIIMAPVFARGMAGLEKALTTWPQNYVAFVTIELADLALTLPKLINDIPAARRGRPTA